MTGTLVVATVGTSSRTFIPNSLSFVSNIAGAHSQISQARKMEMPSATPHPALRSRTMGSQLTASPLCPQSTLLYVHEP